MSFFAALPTRSEKYITSGKSPYAWKQLFLDRNIASIFLFRFSHILCIGIVWAFLPLFARLKFSSSSSDIGILIMLGVLVSGALHLPMGSSGGQNQQKMDGGCRRPDRCGLPCFHLDGSRASGEWYGPVFSLGIGGGIAMPALMAIAVVKGSETDSMGSVMAILTLAHALGMLCGSLTRWSDDGCVSVARCFPAGCGRYGCNRCCVCI